MLVTEEKRYLNTGALGLLPLDESCPLKGPCMTFESQTAHCRCEADGRMGGLRVPKAHTSEVTPPWSYMVTTLNCRSTNGQVLAQQTASSTMG